MKFFSLTALLALASNAVLASPSSPSGSNGAGSGNTVAILQPLNTLMSGIMARDAAVNSTVAAYRAQSITVNQARTYIRGNSSAIPGLFDTFNTTVSTMMAGMLSGANMASLASSVKNSSSAMAAEMTGTYRNVKSVQGLDVEDDPIYDILQLLTYGFDFVAIGLVELLFILSGSPIGF